METITVIFFTIWKLITNLSPKSRTGNDKNLSLYKDFGFKSVIIGIRMLLVEFMLPRNWNKGSYNLFYGPKTS